MAKTGPDAAAKTAKGLSGEFKLAFDRILKDHGVPDWHLESFTLIHKTEVEATLTCPSGEEYDCRSVGGSIVCKCWPTS
jgi:hypothetical protein